MLNSTELRSDSSNGQPDPAHELELARAQAVKYGRDLAQIFVIEKQRREELEIAYQAISTVFASTPDSLVVLNEQHLIQRANPAFAALVEQPLEAIIGQPFGSVLHSYDLLVVLNQLAVGAETATQFEITLYEPIQRSISVNIAPLGAKDARGWILVLHDQTRLKRIENQKATFINIASHELRTPLTALLGYTGLLSEELNSPGAEVSAEHVEYLDAVSRGAARLKRTIDALIQFATLNAGEIAPTGIVSFNVFDLIRDVLSDYKAQAERRQVTLGVSMDDPQLSLRADASLVRMVLTQLLSNAISFNRPGGSVHVAVETLGDQLQIAVSDSGKGIPQTELEMIFQPFAQVEDLNSRHNEGLGMGLALVKQAVQGLDGQIWAASKVGVGTTFTVRVPLNRPEMAQPETDLRTQLETTRQQSLVYARDMMTLYRELQGANRTLKEANLQLDEANKLKSNFLSAISHELRSPFASVDFALQALKRHGTERWSAAQRELLDDLTKSSTSARHLIDNLIAYAGLLSKQGRLELAAVSVPELFDEVLASLLPMAQSRKLHLEAQYQRGLTIPAADRKRLSEALWHLVHNAIKFTKANGQIQVQARLENDTILIVVKDTGIGIAPEQQTIIWESFAQLSDALKRGVEGLGLGLALVRYVAVAHGGNVVLQSTPGVGSVIGFWLPLKQQAQDQSNEEAADGH